MLWAGRASSSHPGGAGSAGSGGARRIRWVRLERCCTRWRGGQLPGFGLRITLPAMGPAPIALDFAFPVVYAPYDSKQLFSFFVGFAR